MDDLRDSVDEQLFGNTFDTLEAHTARKEAVANPLRYAILAFLHAHGSQSRPSLVDAVDVDEDTLQSALMELIDVNLIARVPGPDEMDGSNTVYRITTLGRQEIESDINNIQPDSDWSTMLD